LNQLEMQEPMMDITPKKNPSPEDTWAKPVDRLTVTEAPSGVINQNVNGRHLTSPLNGFGQLWQKTYQISLKEADVSPEEVVKLWKARLPDLMPSDSRFYPSLSGVKPGEVILINATLPGMPGGMPVSTGVLVLYADEVSFSVMTPEGHPEAGFNTFSAYQESGATIAQIQSLARANDPIFEVGFRLMGGSKQQERIWHTVLTNLGQEFGVTNSEVSMLKVCVDPKIQWSQAGNVWHNSVVRTTLSAPVRFAKKVFKR
jgi:hypothetical protein